MSQAGAAGSSGPIPPGSGISMRPYIVGPTNSDFTTIQAAINQAVTDGASSSAWAYILVKSNNGPYVENITLADGIYVYANDTTSNDALGNIPRPVTLQGRVTFALPALDSAKISGINIAPTSGFGIQITGGNVYISNCSSDGFTGTAFLDIADATQVSLNNNNFSASGGSTQYMNIAATTTVNIYDDSSGINFPTNPSTITGAGTVNWNAQDVTYVGQINTANTTTNFVAKNSTFNGNGTLQAFTSGAGTTGSYFAEHCNYIDFDTASPLVDIGNLNMIPGIQFCTFDAQYDFTLASGQVQHASVYMVDNRGPNEEGFVFSDAKTGFSQSRYIQNQSFKQTTDDTNQILVEVPVPAGSAVVLQGIVNGTKSDWSDSQGGSFVFQAQRQSAGNVTSVGSNVIQVSGSAATFFCTVDTGTQTMRVIVNGVAATTYNWGSTYQYQTMVDNT